MSLKKGALSLATVALLATVMGAGLAFADEDYTPTTLGNPDYDNQVDLVNGVYVSGIDYTDSMSQQNVDTLEAAAALSNQFGTEGGDAYALTVINKLDQDIVKLEAKELGESDYTDLGLTSAIEANGGEACWWYTQTYTEVSVTNRSGDTYVMPTTTTYRATLEDGTTVEFHDVNMKGVLTLAFLYSDEYDVNYVERTTVTNHTPDPTLYYETNLARGYADDSEETYTAEEFNYHVNSAVRMGDLQITESRGGGWDSNLPDLEDLDYILDFGVYTPLYGEPSGDYTDGTYEYLYWNRHSIVWRQTNGDAGTEGEAEDVEGAGEYGGDLDERVDIHPGMEDGDWWYTDGEES